MKITGMLFMAAFSDLVTTFQPKTWPNTLEIVFVKLNKALKSIIIIDLFELLKALHSLVRIKIFCHH